MDEEARNLSKALLDFSLRKIMSGAESAEVSPEFTISYEDLGSCGLIAAESLSKIVQFTSEQQVAIGAYAEALFDLVQAAILYRRENPEPASLSA